MLHLSRRRFIPTMGGGAAAAATYAEVLRDTYSASEVWPLVNISSGTTITAFIDSARNGTLTGWDLQNAAGPVTGTLAPYSDGTNDFGSLNTASLVSLFDMNVYSVFGFVKAPNWASSIRRILQFDNASDIPIQILNNGVGNNLRFLLKLNGTTNTIDYTTSRTDWFSFGQSVSTSSDEFKAFIDGSQTGSTVTSIGTPSGNPITKAAIGNFYDSGPPTNVWLGHFAYIAFKFGSIWSPTDFANMHAAASTAGAD